LGYFSLLIGAMDSEKNLATLAVGTAVFCPEADCNV